MDNMIEATDDERRLTQRAIDEIITPATIYFIDVGEDRTYSRGTGTLIRLGSYSGIVTAGHVVKALKEDRWDVEIANFAPHGSCLVRVPLDKNQNAISIYDGENEFGPDLGFVELFPDQVERLAGVASFINLERHSALSHEAGWRETAHVEMVFGAVDELMPAHEHSDDGVSGKVRMLCAEGETLACAEDAELEVLRFRPFIPATFDYPNSAKGMSGGGLWVVRRPVGNEVPIAHFAGVAFYENLDEHRTLQLHGPRALFETLMPKIKELKAERERVQGVYGLSQAS